MIQRLAPHYDVTVGTLWTDGLALSLCAIGAKG